jgi:hypothetical protein
MASAQVPFAQLVATFEQIEAVTGRHENTELPLRPTYASIASARHTKVSSLA